MKPKPSSPPPYASRSGFTLLEIMLVVVIIGFIAVVAINNLNIGGTSTKARRTSTISLIGQYVTAVETYRMEVGKVPPNLEALVNDPGVQGWNGPYILKLKDDLWGEPFQYTASGSSYEIISNAGGSEEGPISSKDL